MVSAFGLIDYIVVLLSAVLTIKLLREEPSRLLFWLPLLLTIDFFIPLGTQLTPSRLIPIILGAWLLISGNLITGRNRGDLAIIVVLIGLFASATFSLSQGEAGSRPLLRALHYGALIALFIFTIRVARGIDDVKLMLWGLFMAAAVHSTYGLYQIFADSFGLPYRGIVYDQYGPRKVAYVNGILRINGLADEPKRLGNVLLCGAIVATYLSLTTKQIIMKRLAAGAVLVFLLTSALTFSSSYFAAAGLTLALALLTSFRLIRYSYAFLILAIPVGFFFRAEVQLYGSAAAQMFESRVEEVDQGLSARKVYRQELFAEDFVKRKPQIILTGLGLGQYNQVLHEHYGRGVGITGKGGIIPINSQIFEVMFDFGLAGLLVLYGFGGYIMLRVGKRNLIKFTLWLLVGFLLIQSMTIQCLPLLVLVSAGALRFSILFDTYKKARPREKRSAISEDEVPYLLEN